ncbi:MAG: DUF3467 domain-containing protein [Pyrinomonadaceae bacterium]
MPKTRATKKKKTEDRVIPVIWNFPDDLWSGYATNIIVQAGEQELYLSFFEAQPPIILQPEDWEELESVNAECIARIIVTPDRLAKFIDVLQQQLDTFNKKRAAQKS